MGAEGNNMSQITPTKIRKFSRLPESRESLTESPRIPSAQRDRKRRCMAQTRRATSSASKTASQIQPCGVTTFICHR